MVAPERDTPGHHGEALRNADDEIHRQREPGGLVVARLEIEPIDPQQHRAARDQREAHDPGIEQHLLDESCRPVAPITAAGRKAISTPMMKRRACGSLNMPMNELPQPHRIDRQQGQDGAELNQDREALAEIVVAEAEKLLHEQEMPGRRDRYELGQSLDHAEDRRLDDIECMESSTAEEGAAGARSGGTWQDGWADLWRRIGIRATAKGASCTGVRRVQFACGIASPIRERFGVAAARPQGDRAALPDTFSHAPAMAC